jgi:hypothetical protein
LWRCRSAIANGGLKADEFLSDHVVPAQSDGDAVAVVPVAVTDAPKPIEIVVAA